jgi:hypothetical protein
VNHWHGIVRRTIRRVRARRPQHLHNRSHLWGVTAGFRHRLTVATRRNNQEPSGRSNRSQPSTYRHSRHTRGCRRSQTSSEDVLFAARSPRGVPRRTAGDEESSWPVRLRNDDPTFDKAADLLSSHFRVVTASRRRIRRGSRR